MEFLKENIRYIFIVIVILFLLSTLILFNNESNDDIVLIEDEQKDDMDLKESKVEIEGKEIKVESFEDIYIHISGEIEKSGIQKLKYDSRVIDAVKAAGGLKTNADLDRINLARILKDEDKIYIPKIGEVLEIKDDTIYNEESGNEKETKLDINKAKKEELINLPGIGEKTADKILEYRSKNNFETIEDLMNVSGIGKKKFEAISNKIIVRE